MKVYRFISLTLAVVFAATGILFLVSPDRPVSFFNSLSLSPHMMPSPAADWSLYLALAVGYMYLVTLLALLMFRYPENHHFPFLLANAKLASSVLSLALYLLQAPYLIYLANFIVDGVIGVVVLAAYLKIRKTGWVSF